MLCSTEYHVEESMFYGSIPHIMGTRFEMLMIASRAVSDSVWDRTKGLLEDLDSRLNRFDPGSEVARINARGWDAAGTEVEISAALEEILECSRKWYRISGGLFDVTLGDFSAMTVSDGRIEFSKPDVHLDFGGLAKGFAIGKIKDTLHGAGIENAFVDLGGSAILALGHHPYGDCWKVSLPNPFAPGIIREFELKDKALSISGNTESYSGHIVNPVTGERSLDRRVCCVEGDDPVGAEVLSTVLMIADEKTGEKIVPEFGNVETEIFEL